MDDLTFSKNVSEIPAGQPLPAPYQKTEKVQLNQAPDIQGAMTNYAEASNWMSSIGSFIASKSSNAIAKKIGGDLGKNPQGDIGIPITDFDKTMQDSYNTQAQATLGLQADKLITDSNIAAAKVNRVTPDLIAKTNQSISIGLQNIYKNAPSDVLPSLQKQYGALQLNQHAELSARMFREQNEDLTNNAALSAQTNAEHAYSFGLHGQEKDGLAAIETTKKLTQSEVAARRLTPIEAKQKIDTARQSYLNGKTINQYEAARAQGKGEDYLKSIADKKPDYLSDEDYAPVTQNLMTYVSRQDALRSQDQSLAVAKFNTSLALNPMAPDMPQQLQQVKQNVSPETYEKVKLDYINSIKKYNKDTGDVNKAFTSWGNLAGVNDQSRNKAFVIMRDRYVAQNQRQNNPITQEQADVQIAASAGGVIPIFRDTIKNNINSGNPTLMDSAVRQIHALYSANASHAIAGLSDSDKSIYTQYESLRDSLPPEEAAKIAIQNANQDPDMQKMNKEKWASFVKSKTYGGVFGTTLPSDWALSQVGLSKNDFINPGIANEYGNMILNKYSTLYQNMNGDQVNALKLTKEEVDANFGYTGVNGPEVKTLHPIEKVLGYAENGDSVPFIQQDVINNLNKSFVPTKEAFNKKQSNVYWDVIPQPTHKDNPNTLYGQLTKSKNQPIQIKRYMKTSSGVKSDTYNVVLIGNSFNWDIALQTDSGIRPLVQIAPYLGIQTYTPNKKAIDAAYRNHGKL